MTQIEKDDIILKAAIEINPEYLYSIRSGTLGMTLYIETNGIGEAHVARKIFPMEYEGLRTIVVYKVDQPA